MAATVIDFATGKASPPAGARLSKSELRVMYQLWAGRQYLVEAALHESRAALARLCASHRLGTYEGSTFREQLKAAEEAHLEAQLQLMLTPATSHKALKWKREMQNAFLKRARDKWLPVLVEDAERLGVDPATIIVEPPPPSQFEKEVDETKKCFTAALRLLAAAPDADPDLKASAETFLAKFGVPAS